MPAARKRTDFTHGNVPNAQGRRRRTLAGCCRVYRSVRRRRRDRGVRGPLWRRGRPTTDGLRVRQAVADPTDAAPAGPELAGPAGDQIGGRGRGGGGRWRKDPRPDEQTVRRRGQLVPVRPRIRRSSHRKPMSFRKFRIALWSRLTAASRRFPGRTIVVSASHVI